MNPQCPHCHKPIELLGMKEIKDEYGLGPNMLVKARQNDVIGDPWLDVGNRKLYLRSTLDDFVKRERPILKDMSPEVLATQINLLLDDLSEEQRKELRERILSQ